MIVFDTMPYLRQIRNRRPLHSFATPTLILQTSGMPWNKDIPASDLPAMAAGVAFDLIEVHVAVGIVRLLFQVVHVGGVLGKGRDAA